MKVFSGLCIALFLVFAFVQFNDPDPWLWGSLYLLMAGLSLGFLFEKLPAFTYLLALVLCVLIMIGLWPGTLEWYRSGDRSLIFDDIAKMQNIYIEEAREFLGLAICVGALATFYFHQRKVQAAA